MKNFITFLVLASAIGGGYLYYQYTQAKTALVDMNTSVATYEASLVQRRVDFQNLVKTLELRKAAQDKQAALTDLQAKHVAMKETYARALQQKKENLTAIRQSMVGQIIPAITLTDGRKLAQVKILKADDSGVSISISSGVQKLLPSELPGDLRQRFHY